MDFPTSALQGSGFLFKFGETYAKSRRNLQVFEIVIFIIIIYMAQRSALKMFLDLYVYTTYEQIDIAFYL